MKPNETLVAQYRETKALAEGPDLELAELANAELPRLEEQLLPPDVRGRRNVILEVRPGTGGDEAELFAAELFRMYTRYAQQKNWRFVPLTIDQSDL
ncbi:PCRF domain-containing protein, partial [Candidatus Berkelbacteria bacterium]|nr:PCRF domain-containing protein [Candidatus Berkelbacteria bacterium]